MIETHIRKTYQKICVDPLINLRMLQRFPPTFFTCIACLSGICIIPLLAFGYPVSAFLMLTLSGFMDTVDGSIARQTNRTSPSGAALDIVSDRIVEFAIIMGLYAVDPIARALPSLLMLGSILLCITSFLIVGVFTEKETDKSFFYSPGLIERAEAFIFFAIMILFPSLFTMASYLFTFLVFLTALIRMRQFTKQQPL